MRKLLYMICVMAIASVMVATATTRSKKRDIMRNMDTFSAIIKELQTFYVDSIDIDKSVGTAIDAMLDELDPYTEYFARSESEDFKATTTGEYAGIGSYIMQRNGNVYISGPHKGGPAWNAGLRHGDLLITIDGDTVLGMATADVSQRLKGTPESTVRVKVKRPYVEDSILTFDIVRKKIQLPSVAYYGLTRDGMGYIMLTSFTDKSPNEVRQALTELLKHPELKSIVLDLRGNGGGFLESAVDILGNFLPKGTEVLRTRGKGHLDEKVYKTSGKPMVPEKLPVFVLIDGGTASASEITAGALQDLDRAVIVGTRSFGKGLVQTTRALPGDGMLKVTVAKYYIPSGRLIQAIDYSHRNEDGSVGRIPDSLTSVFDTKAGRKVRDGGGITPDVTVEYPEISRLVYNVVRDNWAFDFANKYRATHESIAPALDFEITDSIYEDFKAFVDPARFDYDKVCDMILEQLRKAAKVEGYMSDSLNQQLDVLQSMMRHPLEKDLDTHREAISPYLRHEIVERYYSQDGRIASSLKEDIVLDSVAAVLAEPGRYQKILRPTTAK